MKNPLLIKKYKASKNFVEESIYFVIEAKSEEHARLLLIEELENLGVHKPLSYAIEEYIIVELKSNPTVDEHEQSELERFEEEHSPKTSDFI